MRTSHFGSYKLTLLFIIPIFFWQIILHLNKHLFLTKDSNPRDPNSQLLIDKRVFGNEQGLDREFHAPLQFASKIDATKFRLNASCAKYTTPFEIKYSNLYWQVQEMKASNVVYYMYGAYFDNRTSTAIVRVITFLTKLVNVKKSPYCQLWFDGEQKPTLVQASPLVKMFVTGTIENSKMLPFLVSCNIPSAMSGRIPASVSLVEAPCEKATNNLRVIYNPLPAGEKKKDFLVCVKALFLTHKPHMAVRIIEWIELLKILGAQKIVIYNFQTHENITKVLDYYASKGDFEHVPVTLPGNFPNSPQFISEFLANEKWFQYKNDAMQQADCLYRNLYKFNYVTTLDIDEVIVPISKDNWRDLVYKVALPRAAGQNKSLAAFLTRNTFFMDDQIERQSWFPDIPKYMHMLQNVNRNKFHDPVNHTSMHTKAFFDVGKIIFLYCHYPVTCVTKECDYLTFDPSESQLQHYCIGQERIECRKNETVKGEKSIVRDFTLWKYKDNLVARTNQVLKDTGFLK